MGSFSWLRAERTTRRANIAYGDKYKLLIPKEFGGGFIKDEYCDYGDLYYKDKTYDLYGILAYWNKVEGMKYEGDTYPSTMKDIFERGNTTLQSNRCKGIDIGCEDEKNKKLKYPLKLVSVSYKGTYEDCMGRSYTDPDQGFFIVSWNNLFARYPYYKKLTKNFNTKEGK